MFDVNPLGPMMHLKDIEREALALRAARVESRSRVLKSALAWVVKLLKAAEYFAECDESRPTARTIVAIEWNIGPKSAKRFSKNPMRRQKG
jgi:hypothetical protein